MLTLTRSEQSNPTGLNSEFEYHGEIFHINLAYDTVLSFYKLLDDKCFSDEEKVSIAFRMFFDDPTIHRYIDKNDDLKIRAFQEISRYINEDPYIHYDGQDQEVESNVASPKYYSFQQDAEAIYSSFYQQYGIDLLYQKQKMHWDQFKALFAGLGPDTYFMRIVQIRQEDISKLEGDAQREMIEAQQRYALEETQSQEAVQNQIEDFGNMLMAIAKS